MLSGKCNKEAVLHDYFYKTGCIPRKQADLIFKESIIDNEDSKSGKAISLVNGSLSQIISYPLIIGEKYIFSFKASGTNINISIVVL